MGLGPLICVKCRKFLIYDSDKFYYCPECKLYVSENPHVKHLFNLTKKEQNFYFGEDDDS